MFMNLVLVTIVIMLTVIHARNVIKNTYKRYMIRPMKTHEELIKPVVFTKNKLANKPKIKSACGMVDKFFSRK